MTEILQLPAAMPVTTEPLTVQTAGFVEPKVTGRPDVAAALTELVPPIDRVVGLNVTVPMV